MTTHSDSPRIAIIGAGVSGAACAASLQRAGLQVTLFDRSRGVGGRMATRRAKWVDTSGAVQRVEFDHGAQLFGAQHPRFRAVVARAQAAGCVATWRPRVHAPRLGGPTDRSVAPVPSMPSFCRHLIGAASIRLEQAVQRLQRGADGWPVVTTGGESTGPFDHVMLATPPAQAALLLAGHHDAWADTLAAVRMEPCWTLMAATADADWPWDAAEPARGPLAWVSRNDRRPGRAAPPGCASWVAHASAAWSAAHLEDDARDVTAALSEALARLLPCNTPLDWHHASAHRWRYAFPAEGLPGGDECWWDGALGLGVCGDFFGAAAASGAGVEAAWRSGDELADVASAWLEAEQDAQAA